MSVGRVLIIGSHPVMESIVGQFGSLGREVAVAAFGDDIEPDLYDEFVILTSANAADPLQEDRKAEALLRELAAKGKMRRTTLPMVHLLLQSRTSLQLFRTMDLPPEINEAFEVWPFTMEDAWAQNILVRLPSKNRFDYPPLDREPLTADSRKFVHLVICGFDSQAAAVALNAALVAHFPNYNGAERVPLRTRITIIDKNIADRRDAFVAEHQHLFDHSFYRAVWPESRRTELHRPIYFGKRTDFVDVEWEFVDATANHSEVRQRLSAWAADDKRVLTLVVSQGSDELNLRQCMALPSEIFERHIPVFVKQQSCGVAGLLGRGNVCIFGMEDCGYDVTLPLVKMAKLVKYFYDCSYDDRGVPTELPWEDVERAWQSEHSFRMRFSNIYNVMTVTTKMRSLGRHDESDAERFYALTDDEIRMLAATEHNRWSVERLLTGSRPCTESEKREIGENIAAIIAARGAGEVLPEDLKKRYKKSLNVHYDLCAYDELGVDPTGKDAKTYDYDLTACIPLIVKTYFDDSNG